MTRPDVVSRIADFNRGREAERLELKYQAMRGSPFAFFRGTAHLFWEDWPAGETLLDDAPRTWSCGDLHLENFGTYRGDNRLTYFDINDFDEAALAPATRDFARLLTSVHVAARSLGLSSANANELCEVALTAYISALAEGKARWIERSTAQGMVRELLRGLRRRTRVDLLDLRTTLKGGKRQLRVDGRHALPLVDEERERVIQCLRAFAESQDDPRFYKVLDVARRVAGTGSLGVERFVILVRGRGSPGGNFLLDLKESRPSALAPRAVGPQPDWHDEGERVANVQRWMQAISPALLQVVRFGDRPFTLRELQPAADRLVLENWNGKLGRLRKVVQTMGHVSAWSQLRSASRRGSAGVDELLAFAERKDWRAELAQYAKAYRSRVEDDWKQFLKSPLGASIKGGARKTEQDP
ncbi:MAG: DUF2252 domain-containing protein [Gemmatimonadales bacterium]